MKTTVILILMFLCQNISAQVSPNNKTQSFYLQQNENIAKMLEIYSKTIEENIKLKEEIQSLKVRDSVMTKRYEYLQELLFKVIAHKYDTVYIGNMRVEKFINVIK